MPELTIEFIRACEEMALKFTTVENLQTVSEFVSHLFASITNWLIFLHP